MIYLKLYYKLLEWEWYTDSNVMRLFIHCLLKANRKDKKWHGIEIKAGSFITSYENLASELGLTVMQIRTAIKKLNLTGEITNKTTSRCSIITVKNWKQYQANNTQDNNQITNKQQTNNNQITTTRECIECKNEENVFFIEQKTKKSDPFINNPIIDKFYAENKRVFGKKLYLTAPQRQRVMELNTEIEDFPNTITTAFEKLKTLDFDLPNFSPNAAWLLRDDNYTNVLNGLYEGKKKQDIWEELREKERLKNGTS